MKHVRTHFLNNYGWSSAPSPVWYHSALSWSEELRTENTKSQIYSQSENFSAFFQEEIRRGHRPNYHMLNACDLVEKKHSIQVVDFRSVYTVPYDFLIGFAADQGKRVRLLSPYREKLSQAFGNFFSRVGLPTDIQPFR